MDGEKTANRRYTGVTIDASRTQRPAGPAPGLRTRERDGAAAHASSTRAPHARIDTLRVRRDARLGGLRLSVTTLYALPGDTLRAVLLDGAELVGETAAPAGGDLAIVLPTGRRTPSSPAFTVRLSLIRHGRRLDVVDCCLGRIGARRAATRRANGGS